MFWTYSLSLILFLLITEIKKWYQCYSNTPECNLMERKTTLIEDLNNAFCRVLMSLNISNIFRSRKFSWFAKLIVLINGIRRLWNNFSLVCSEDDIFCSIPYGRTFFINLVRFLNLNRKNWAKFGIFLPKWLITLKTCLF